MSLLIEFPTLLSVSLGEEGGDPGDFGRGGVAVLPTPDLIPDLIPDNDAARILLPMQWSEFCYACERDCTFAAFGVCGEGLVVECTGCGVPRVARFTRMQTEVA